MVAKLLIYKILQLFCVMVLGFLLVRFKIVKPRDSVVLSKLSLYLLMPAALLNAFNFQLTELVAHRLGMAFFAATVIHLILCVLDLLYGKLVSKNAVERASIMYPNVGNLIIPIVSFILGAEWVVFSAAFLAVQLLFVWSHGVRLFRADEKFRIGKVLLNVNVIAIAVGLALMLLGLSLPDFVGDVTAAFGGVLGPVGMLITGMLAATVDFKRVFTNLKLYRVVVARMVIYPCIMLGVIKLFSLIPLLNDKNILLIAFLSSMTPSATTIVQFSQIYDQDTEYATAINIFTTAVCVVTMPLMVMAFEWIV